MKKYLKILLLAGAVAGVLGFAVFYFLKKPAPNGAAAPAVSRKEMENIAMVATASFGFPKMMDADARAEGVQVTEDNLFQIFVTLVTVDTRKEDHGVALARIKNGLPGSACQQRSVRFLLFKGITVKFSFKSENGEALFDYVLKPEVCAD